MATYSRRLLPTKNSSNTSRKMTYGKYSFRLSEAWNHSMKFQFFIVIWKVQTSSCRKMELQNSETWTSAKLQRKACSTLKPELHTMHRLKCGEINPTTTSLISGRLAAYCMKQLLLSLHSGQRTCKDFTRKFSKAFIPRFQVSSAMTWPRS